MNWAEAVRERFAALRIPADKDLVDEFAAHLEQEYDDARAEGLDDAAASRRALAILGEEHPLLQAARARRPAFGRRLEHWSRQEVPVNERGSIMDRLGFARDARYALRMLLRAPTFSVVAILTFAVGIGVNAAVFSVVHAVLVKPLAYPDADRVTLVWMDNRRQGIKDDITSYPNYLDWRNRNSVYAHLAGYTGTAYTLTGAEQPERLIGAVVTANFFDVMGIQPALGRVFTAENEVPGKDTVVVLSHGLWQRRFGGARDVLGRTLILSGESYEVIGVMPAALQWPRTAELWAPLAPDDNLRDARSSFWLPVIGRLKPGVPVEQAQAEMGGISTQLEQTYPFMRGFGANVVPLHQQIVGDIERPLLVLMAAVGFVLLIACANLANLMFGRTAARRKELAIRNALGAGRGRLVRQIVTEATVLAGLGGLIGVVFAYWATGVFVTLGGDSIPRADTIRIDSGVLVFAFALATLAAMLSGLLPALQASRAASADQLREGGRQSGGTATHRTRSVLVGAEVALAFVLLIGAALLTRSLWSMQQVDRGFRSSGIATMNVSAPAVRYPTPVDVRAFYSRLLERLRATPGIESVATATAVLQPVVTSSGIYSIEGQPLPPPEQRIEYPVEIVSPGFFETLGVQVVRGRTFTDQDHAQAPRAIVINESLARLGWPGQDPIGRRMRAGDENSQAPWLTVVGVIRDVHRADVTRTIRPELYLCALQSTPRTQMLLVKSAGDPTAIVPVVRSTVQALDPQLPLFAVGTLDESIAKTMNQPRFQATLLVVFAAVALVLAAIGIYGVTSHAVSQRTQEVGIRMALGAHRRDVLRMMLTQHLLPAVIGVVTGMIGAVLLGRYLDTLLYGIGATDPLTFAAIAATLVAVAMLACWIPARRATRVDPLIAVRAE
jgi:putative ABC transport system permease protein